ncbi:MAG: zinc ribbon domain-containing protein [Pseudomonadota bacterium]|nr:zinc ribbon domain-containing protein [Pseudomonadota bacterium]
MPIYEFYCEDCHTIFNFFSRRIDTETTPSCPRCGRDSLARRPSVFAVSSGRGDDDGDDPLSGMDEDRMERVMASMAGDMDGIDGDDPRQAARMMRRMYEAMGVKPGSGMEEAIHRMESGEDPDRIEEEMGDLLEGEDPFAAVKSPGAGLRDLRNRLLPPRVDDTLYDLE